MTWWKNKWGRDKVCPITKTRLRPGKNKNKIPYTYTLPCKHSFTRSALLEWLKKSNKCPICRKPSSILKK